MADVRSTLDKVWNTLRQASIVDDLLIIEYIAALLIEMSGEPWPFAEELRPQKQQVRYNVDEHVLQNLLRDASQQITKDPFRRNIMDIKTLFDPHILFFPSRYAESKSYPTPRHIINFMLIIAQIESDNTFADLSCGSGSTLINNGIHKQKYRPLGIDISANWIRIAAANAFLHKKTNIELHQADAFRYFELNEKDTFTRIVMSPPLDSMINTSALTEATHVRQSSDIAFTELILGRLKESSRGVTLVSQAFIDSNKRMAIVQRREANALKVWLVDNHILRAVITQENGSFITKEPVHILSLSKGQAAHTNFVWFCRIEKDGYPLESQRDFTQDANVSVEANDMPFLQQILRKKWREKDFDEYANDVHIKPIYFRKILRGFLVEASAGMTITHIQKSTHYSHTFYISTQNTDTTLQIKTYQTRIAVQSLTESQRINETKHLLKRDVFLHGEAGQFAAISADGRLLGITQTYEQIRTNNYNFSPEYYLARYHETQTLWIQNESYIAPLFMQPSASQIEPVVTLPETSQYEDILPRMLNGEQYKTWQAITQYTRYFTPEDIRSTAQQNDVSSTLDLLESLGLIRRVSLTTSENGTDLIYRRLAHDEISIGEPIEAQPEQPLA